MVLATAEPKTTTSIEENVWQAETIVYEGIQRLLKNPKIGISHGDLSFILMDYLREYESLIAGKYKKSEIDDTARYFIDNRINRLRKTCGLSDEKVSYILEYFSLWCRNPQVVQSCVNST